MKVDFLKRDDMIRWEAKFEDYIRMRFIDE